MGEFRYDGRVAVITGAGRGLGRAYALLLGSRGAKVVVNDYGVTRHGETPDRGPAQEVVDEIVAAGGEAVASTDSVASPEGAQAIVDTALTAFGQVDILIHNAGINRAEPLHETSWEQFSTTLGVHLHGGFHIVRAALPHMRAAGYGRVVLTSSIAGLYGNRNLAGYAVSKAGLIGLSNVVALEGADYGVQCNAIVPAAVTRLSDGIDTSAFPAAMVPEEVAPAVAWMVHEDCKASGEIFVALAGRVAKAYIAETPGVWREGWTIEQVAGDMAAIEDKQGQLVFETVPSGYDQHLGYSFARARGES